MPPDFDFKGMVATTKFRSNLPQGEVIYVEEGEVIYVEEDEVIYVEEGWLCL